MKRTYKLMVVGILLVLLVQVQAAEAEPQVHRVKPGETLATIAKKFGVKMEELLSGNKYLRYPNQIDQDLLLVIPETEEDTQEKNSRDKDVKSEAPAPGAKAAENQKSALPGDVSGQSSPGKASSGDPEIETLAELYRQYKSIVFFSGSPKTNQVALTFDDGPSEVTTGQVLDILGQYNIKGTFFLVGENVSRYPQVVNRIVREGHLVAGHSWSHIELDKAAPEKIKKEVIDTENAIFQASGKRPALVRPPYGSLNRSGLEYLKQNGYKVVNWSADSLDWKYPDNGNLVIVNTLKDVQGGSILLFHTMSGKEPSNIISNVLPEIICSLRSQGYQFVTVDQLLSIQAYKE